MAQLLTPGQPAQVIRLENMRNGEGEPIELANLPHMTVLAKLPCQVQPLAILRRKK